MAFLTAFLSDPIVGSVGYVLSFVAAFIAIGQFVGKSKVLEEMRVLTLKYNSVLQENNHLKLQVSNIDNNNEVNQGEKSQYFQDNSGPVSIDNRG